MIKRWIFGFSRIHPIYDFLDFPENRQSDNDYFREKLKKNIFGWIRKNPRIHPSNHFLWFSLKNENLGLKKWIFRNYSECCLSMLHKFYGLCNIVYVPFQWFIYWTNVTRTVWISSTFKIVPTCTTL